MSARRTEPTYLGTLRFGRCGEALEITHGPCPRCGGPVYLVRRPADRDRPALWDSIEMVASENRDGPSGTPHACPPIVEFGG